MNAADLDALAPHQVEERLMGPRSLLLTGPGPLLRHLHRKASEEAASMHKLRSSTPLPAPWAEVERRVFGDVTALLSSHETQGQGLGATLMGGPEVSLQRLAGLDAFLEFDDASSAEADWQRLLEHCPSVECIEVGLQDDRPSMGDVFYWICVDDPHRFSRQLREVMLSMEASSAVAEVDHEAK